MDKLKYWDEILKQMKTQYMQIDQSQLSLEIKLVAWKKFIDEYGVDNPYSDKDNALLRNAKINVENLTKKIAHQEKQNTIEGFAYLRDKTYSAGGQTYTIGEYLHHKTGMVFVLIPGGTFMMGSDSGSKDERPVHKVKINSFLMSKCEVTQKVYKNFMNNNPSKFKGEKRPVENVTWYEAEAFCKKVGLSLPTESQWEYACRSGSTGDYYWEGSGEDYAWYAKNSNNETHIVGRKKTNAFGLHDMIGNVFEFCRDSWHQNYKGAPKDGKAWEGDDVRKVIRGGMYGSKMHSSVNRAERSSYKRLKAIGFRVCGFLQK